MDGRSKDSLSVPTSLEEHTWRADQLGDNDPLGSVDDEGTLLGHHRKVAHKYRLLFNLPRHAVGECRLDEDRDRIGEILLPALLFAIFRKGLEILVIRVEI